MKAKIEELEEQKKDLQAIMENFVPKGDPYDDEQIKAKFRELQYAIKDVVNQNFRATKEKIGWASYDKIAEPDERNLFLQAHIATILAHEYFGDDAQFFSYDSKMDYKLADFENFLVDRGGKLRQKRSFQNIE